MKPAVSVAVLLLVLAILAAVVGRALSDRGSEPFSGTRKFTIDGRTFRVADPAVDSLSLLARELSERGIEIPLGSTDPFSVLDSPPVEALDEEPAAKNAPTLPRGFETEHAMRLDTGAGPVEIAFGRVVCGEKDLLNRLRSSGWECLDPGMPGAIAHVTKGKEASFVVLEKSERRFLAIRRAVR